MIHKIKLNNSNEKVLVDDQSYQFITTDPELVKLNFINSLRKHSSGCVFFQKYANGKLKTIYLHRLLAEKFKFRQKGKKKTVVSALNGNKLDCRLENIVWRTKAIAMRHRKTTNKTGYTGVHKENNKYKAVIAVNGRSKHIGIYPTVEEAAMAYNKVSRMLYGEHGKINIIKPKSQ